MPTTAPPVGAVLAGGAIVFLLGLFAAPFSQGAPLGQGTPLSQGKDAQCVAPARWLSPATRKSLGTPRVIGDIAHKAVVLLGETHNNRDHHRWQLHTLAALLAVNPNMVIAFEAFPRRVQPALDRWVRGQLSEKQLLRQSQWDTVWRFDPSLYLPLFNFARMHRIAMIGMNVDRSLISAINRKGWDGVAPKDREGVGVPAPASAQYRASLKTVFNQHVSAQNSKGAPAKPTTGATVPKRERFDHFVTAQITWDRAMAERIAQARRGAKKPLVVAIVGRGHLDYGYGIAHQLKALGVENVATLEPWDSTRPCTALKENGRPVADFVFGLPSHPQSPHRGKPKLGVLITQSPQGVKVDGVVKGSVGAAAGIEKGDVIVRAAGRAAKSVEALVSTIQAQAPGTWLPLTVRRAGAVVNLIAKFPPRAEKAPTPTAKK